MCGFWPLLSVWDRGFPGLPPTQHPPWSLLECAAHGRSSQCGTHKYTSVHESMHLGLIHRARAKAFAMHSILAAANQHLRFHRCAGVSVKADAKQLSYEQHRAPNPVAQEHEKESKLWHMPLQQHDQTPRNPEVKFLRIGCCRARFQQPLLLHTSLELVLNSNLKLLNSHQFQNRICSIGSLSCNVVGLCCEISSRNDVVIKNFFPESVLPEPSSQDLPNGYVG